MTKKYLYKEGDMILSREATMLNGTDYHLNMEWFPSNITKREEDYNPDGTAVITGKFAYRSI